MKIECHDLVPKIGDIFRHAACRKMSPSIVMIWCPSVTPLPRRCAACVVAGAPPAAASAPSGPVQCSIQSCKTVCGFYRRPSRKHTIYLAGKFAGLIGSAALRGGKIVERLERTVGEQDRAPPREVGTDEEEEEYYERSRYTGPFAKLLEMSG